LSASRKIRTICSSLYRLFFMAPFPMGSYLLKFPVARKFQIRSKAKFPDGLSVGVHDGSKFHQAAVVEREAPNRDLT
ncbi:MAG TPA: hypothetical protein VEC35_15135, partial [Noviherbaspirillum sp.]|nr:hypothetical protein [Noviherbaspirillum sp.]